MFVDSRCRETHYGNLVVIQTHRSHRLYLAADFLGLRRSGVLVRRAHTAQAAADDGEIVVCHGFRHLFSARV